MVNLGVVFCARLCVVVVSHSWDEKLCVIPVCVYNFRQLVLCVNGRRTMY